MNENINEYISDVVTIDQNAADAINKSKNDFYDKYEYLKPDIEKSWLEEKVDNACEWCKEHWKAVVTIVIVIAAVACLFIPGINAAVAGLAYGKLILAVSVGVIKGVAIGSIAGLAHQVRQNLNLKKQYIINKSEKMEFYVIQIRSKF